MALKKVISVSKIEVDCEGYDAVRVLTCTKVFEDNIEISAGLHSHVILPGEDYSQESEKVRTICSGLHTDAAIAAYNAAPKA